MTTSVIVVAFNRWDLTSKCLESLNGDFELIVVDNGSTDETVDATIEAEALITVAPNQGYTRGANIGAAAATGDVLLFLNNDTEVPDGWLPPLTTPFEDDTTAIVGCRLVYPDQRVQHAGVYLDRPNGILTAHNHQTEQPSGFVQGVTGACMAVRADVFRALGGYDVGYYNGYEDVDLCLAVSRAGYKIWYTNETTVIHHEGASGPSRWANVGGNVARLQAKWPEVCR